MADGLAKILDDQNESQPKPEGPDGNVLEDWEIPKFRTIVKERIEEEIMKTASQVPKTGDYLEEFAFSKAKSRKEYLDLIAGVMVYVAEFNKRGLKSEEGKEAETSSESKNADSSES